VAYLKLAEEILEKAPFAASRNINVSSGAGNSESVESMRQVIADAGSSSGGHDSNEDTHETDDSEGEGRS
jgi:hypothetical protein